MKNYTISQNLVEEVQLVSHKGKRRGFRLQVHVHLPRVHEIIYVDYGKVAVTMDGSEIHVAPGECIFIPGGVWHSFVGEDDAPFDYLNIMFTGAPPPALFEKSLPVSRPCVELMEKLKQESLLEMPYRGEVVVCVLTELIARLLRQVEFAVPEKLPEAVNRHRYQSAIVNRALNVIADEYSSPLNLKELSRAAGIGESRLAKLFKIETGENFSTILHKQRITVAKHLISEDTFSLKEIANAAGYQSTSFFFKIFKRLTGMTPMAYSKSLGDPTVRE